MEVPEALVSGVANASLAERKPHKLISSVETPLHALQTGELAMRPLRTADRHPPRVSPLSVPPAPFERKQSHTRTMISSAGQARAFACDCLRWAERTDDTERREILLNMTRQWSEIADSLDRREALIEQFGSIVAHAARHLHQARDVVAAKTRRAAVARIGARNRQ
jgi:hypothetical protein